MRRVWAGVAILAALAGAAPAGLAQSAATGGVVLPLSQIRPGMTGYGLTVVHGTTIERFAIQVLGILSGGPGTDLILFRASGSVIDRSGGTASGMSGSPIYINDRIAGALAYGYHFSGPDASLSLATPIEEMLKILEPAASGGVTRRPGVYRTGAVLRTPAGPLNRVILLGSTAEAAAFNAHRPPLAAAIAPVAVPLGASGVTPAALAVLSRALGRFNVVPHQSYAGQRAFAAPPLVPGSSLGVELVRGDVEIGAIGTVTYRRGDAILGFGHPMMNAGPAALGLTTAYIDTVVRSLDFPFKEGSLGTLVGTVTQDRFAGVGGVLGRYPPLFAVRVAVHDAERGTTKVMGAQVVRRSDLAEALVPAAALSLVQRALDRVSGGSAAVRILLRARGVRERIVREDLAYDQGDIATAAMLDVPSATQLLFGNFFRGLEPVDMSIEVAVTNRPNTALLVAARPNARTVHPGERLLVQVRIQPYGGGAPLERVVDFTVPREFPEGAAFLLVGTSGALNVPASPADKFQSLVAQEGTPLGVSSLDEAIDQFESEGKNTEVRIELVPEAVLTAVGSNANPGFQSPAGTTVPTRWVVLGKFQIPMTVK